MAETKKECLRVLWGRLQQVQGGKLKMHAFTFDVLRKADDQG